MKKILLTYLIAINVLAFAIYGLDKAFSKQMGVDDRVGHLAATSLLS